MFNINFKSTGITLHNQTLMQTLQEITEHCATFGYDVEAITITNAETGYGNGINIVSVENVQDVYRNIKSIIDV